MNQNNISLEKVIKEVERIREDHFGGMTSYEGEVLDAVLALLKAQEPVLVRYTTSTIRCPKCNKQITSRGAIHNEIKYCWRCGQAVKWE